MGIIGKLVRSLLYRNDPELLYNPHRKDQDWFIFHGVFNNTFIVLAFGTFLSGFAVHIGAPDLLTGYLALIPSICGAISLFTSILWRRVRNRKRLIILINTLSRSIACLSVPVTLLLPQSLRVGFFMAMLIVSNLLFSFAVPAINGWFVSVIPDAIRGRYVSIRQFFMTLPAMILPIPLARMLDVFPGKQTVFLIIYGAAFALMLLTGLSYYRIGEPTPEPTPARPAVRVGDYFRIPLRNRPLMRFEWASMIIYFALYISYVFTDVYMIRYLNIPYQFITLSTALLYLTQLAVYRYIGRLSDRYGHRVFFNASILLYGLELTLWAMMKSDTYLYLLPVRSLISGCAGAAFIICSFNYRYELMPSCDRDVCEGFHVTITGLVLFAAPLAGRVLGGLIRETPALAAVPFAQFRLLYLLSALMLFALAAAIHAGDRRARRVERECRGMGNATTAGSSR